MAKGKTAEDINLSTLSVDELSKLGGRIEKEIARQRKTQVQSVRGEIERLASGIGMSVEDIFNLDKKRKRSSRTAGVPKYRNPANPGQTWTGRGKRPRWYIEALQKGSQPDDLAISK